MSNQVVFGAGTQSATLNSIIQNTVGFTVLVDAPVSNQVVLYNGTDWINAGIGL